MWAVVNNRLSPFIIICLQIRILSYLFIFIICCKIRILSYPQLDGFLSSNIGEINILRYHSNQALRQELGSEIILPRKDDWQRLLAHPEVS